jgi:hypothetical protein
LGVKGFKEAVTGAVFGSTGKSDKVENDLLKEERHCNV